MLRVLIVEDNRDDVDLVLRNLAFHFGELPYSKQVYTSTQMDLALLEPEGWDCVICDYHVPGFEWPNALNMIRRWRRGILFIVISGYIDDDKGKSAIQDGADDYIGKDKVKDLGALVERWLRLKAAHEDNRKATQLLLDTLEKKKDS